MTTTPVTGPVSGSRQRVTATSTLLPDAPAYGMRGKIGIGNRSHERAAEIVATVRCTARR